MSRVLEPEWLDELPPGEASAQQSRRDLWTLNALLGHRRSMARLLRAAGVEYRARRLIDLGSGDGRFAIEVARTLHWRDAAPQVVLVDRQLSLDPQTRAGFGELEEVTEDVFEFARDLAPTPGTFVMANLFLHHFTDVQLRELFAALAGKVDALAACEPPRSWGAMAAIRLLPLIGCNAVTRHDAAVSVRAGFRDRELSALWPKAGWTVHERACSLFTHGFAAWRS